MASTSLHSARLLHSLALAVFVALFLSSAQAGADYYRHTLFDNSLENDAYFYSEGQASAPSTLELERGKLPVSRDIFFTPPNALRVKWKSIADGGWEAGIRVIDLRNRDAAFRGDTLYFWCYTPEGIAARNLPAIRLEDTAKNFSAPLELSQVAPDIPAKRWVQVHIPLAKFSSASANLFDSAHTAKVVFSQMVSDGAEHILIIDEVAIDDASAGAASQLAPNAMPSPANLKAAGYERHVDLRWDALDSPGVRRYIVYRSLSNEAFTPIGIAPAEFTRFTDYIGKPGMTARYKVVASNARYQTSGFSNEVSATTRPMSDDELLTMLQEACFRYYWEGAHPKAGMALENIPGDDRLVATGASGFGIMAIIVGVDRGFITREQGLQRMAQIVSFLELAPRYHGVWSHFIYGDTAQTIPLFGMFDDGGDIVETAFLMQGLLAARQYFNGNSAQERDVYGRISKLWETVEWDWYRRSPQSDALYWHWSPDWSWHISHRLTGFNETMIVYLLAIASPTHSVPAELYYSGWANQGEVGAKYRRGW